MFSFSGRPVGSTKALEGLVATVVMGAACLALLAGAGAWIRPMPPLDPGLPRRFVEIEGRRIAYVQRGPRAAGASPRDVLLIHGGMGSLEDWKPVFETLALDFRVTAYDRPGFAGSVDAVRGSSLRENASVATGLVHALGLRRPVFVGHSYGAAVALFSAVTAPETPGGLVLLASTGYGGGRPRFAARVLSLPLVGEGVAYTVGWFVAPSGIRAVLEKLTSPNTARFDPSFFEFRERLLSQPKSLTTRARQVTALHAELGRTSPRYDSIHLPVAIVAADGDRPDDAVRTSRRLHASIRDSRLYELKGSSHYVQFDRPDEVVRIVNETVGLSR